MKQILGVASAATLAFVLSLVMPIQAQQLAQIPGFVPDPVNPGRGLIVSQRSEAASIVTFAHAQGGGIAAGGQARASSRAQSFLNAHASAFGLPDAANARVLQESARDEIGVEHVRFQQVYRGIPVTAGQVLVHVKGQFVVGANSEVLADPNVDVTPGLSAAEAVEKARALVERRHDAATAGDVTYTAPRLEVLNRGLLEPGVYPTRLTWFIEAKALAIRDFIWIDAQTGGIALHVDQLTTARNRQIYDAQSDSTLPGVLVRSEGGAATGDVDADGAYNYSGDTYDYYLAQHGRDSFDNAGGTIVSSVHYCEFFCFFGPYQNAFWNGSQMVYGDGFAGADDVDAHELTHAITERTANLFYYVQSGALNESFSDIFGETVDLTNGHGNDAPSVRWKIGEELPASVGIVRDMMTPTLYGDPGKMSDPQFSTAYDYNDDQGGVHTNSGVPNHAYALMVDGGTYNGRTITGIGLTAAAKIEYRALTVYLTSGANFRDDYDALQQACTDLIGVSGITSSTCVQVKSALDAVELGGVWPGNTPVPAFCSAGQTRSDLFFDNFESSVNPNWSTTALQGTGTWTIPDSGWAKSGKQMAFGADFDSTNDAVMSMNNGVTLPAGARMQFSHAFSFEQGNGIPYDGGVLEYSTNGGASWLDAGSLVVAGAPYYTTPISLNDQNPLAGRYAFARNSYGYTATQLDLSSLSGSNIRFRFRVGTDPAVGDIGWVVDDVRIYTCQSGTCTYSISPTSNAFTAAGGSGSVTVTASSGSCGWNATSSAPDWLTIIGGATGSGNGTVTYAVAANTLSTPRSATLTIAGQTFTVTQAGSTLAVTVTAPNGGEKIYTGTPYIVTWNATGAASFDVASSTDGVNFTPIAGCSNLPGTASSCTWNTPGPVTSSGRIRVLARDSGGATLTDVSNALFKIASGTAAITVSFPNTAVNVGIGSMQQIKWSHNLGTESYVRIELSRDNGASYSEVLASALKNTTASSGTFNWRVTGPATTGANALVRITWTNGPKSDVSNVAFTIAAAFLKVTAPATNSNWGFGTSHKQTWTTNLGPLDLVNVQLSTSGIGGTYTTMSGGANIVATAKTATVIAPSTATTTARLKVVWANPPAGYSAVGDNPGNFTLAPPFITVTAPIGGDVWSIGSARTIKWSNNLGTAEMVEIRLSKDNGATYPIVILASTPSDGSQAVTVDPSWGSQTTTRIKVTSLAHPTVVGQSGTFAIQ